MIKRFTPVFLCLLIIIFVINFAHAQERRAGRGGLITGIIVDAKDQTPIEYAYIILYSEVDSTQITGAVTEEDGRFMLNGIRPGKYYLDVKYMGFESYTAHSLQIGRGNRRIDLGEIQLKESLSSTEGIEIVAEKPAMTYLIDKKVINVSQHQTATSGTAADVLENIPSVTVDIEGNVLLRGSASYLVLIDGKPTVLEPSDVLQQIPASTIEDIEIITNPSAKFDPDGTAGIINIITKKGKLNGTSGIVNIDLGLDEKYGADFLLYFRTQKFNFYIGGDYNIRNYPGTRSEERWSIFNDTTSFINSDGSSDRSRNRYSVKGGLDYSITSNDNVSIGLRYGGRAMTRESKLNYDQWNEPGGLHQLYISKSEQERSGDFLALNLDYRHQFAQKGHEIITQVIYHQRDMDEESMDELLDSNDQITSGRKTTEQGPASPLRIKIDYTLPINKKNKIEAGYQSRLGHSEDITSLCDYDSSTGQYEIQPEFSYKIEYDRHIHGLYSMYSGETGSLGYQGGLRAEYTNRKFDLTNTSSVFTLERWDYFPTVHFSYQFSKERQMMASYTRRIKRPRGYSFEPFDTWMDAYNVRRGNPDLKPEYINSYELGYQIFFGRSILSFEGYYRMTTNKIERVRSVYEADITLHTFANAGTSYTFGSELMLNTDVFKLWNVNLMANLYNYRIEGNLLGRPFSRESFNWNTRFNNTLNLLKSTRLQVNAMYNSPSVSAQGSREGYMTLNLGLRQEFLDRALSATLQVRNVLQTARHDFISEGLNFYSHTRFERKAPMVTLNLSYKIHNYKEERKKRDSQGNGDEDEDF